MAVGVGRSELVSRIVALQLSMPLIPHLRRFVNNGNGKKIILSEVSLWMSSLDLFESLSQNGWPSETYQGVEPNSPNAVANVQNEAVSIVRCLFL